ncbi:YihY/virulence factor BrkB family protein [Variovorax saccharolyticus]|uniref:YihY/virulence factor BrkB family protein n=1 Tax=Variovorax saccharolyticus TaxID=3053516 RepID=UPI00257792C8|nr:YihY/virulence factor BrkB family protein [Variovorax sp. J22R187]MDM0019351.1 YihY/virulence factor BrkB family protein [Variovorax sp. J22R187]
MKPKAFLDLCWRAGMAWVDDYAPSMGAAISYYTLFSMAPLLVIVIAIAGRVFGHDAAQGEVVAQIAGLVGPEGAAAVEALLRSADEPEKGLIAGSISLVVLMVGATTVFAELQSALDRIWHVPEREKPSGLWAVLRARLLSFGLILGLAFLLIVSLIVSAGLAAFDSWVGGLLPGWEIALQVINGSTSIAILTLLFALIFKLMPTADIAWRDVWTGAFVTAILFEIGKLLIGLYLGKSGVSESFAAAGSLVVLVAWVYYAAQIFLLGAEFTKAYADSHGSLAGARAMDATERAGQDDGDAGAGAAPMPAMREALPDYSGIARTAATQHEVDRRIAKATGILSQRVVLLAAITIGNILVARWTRRQRASTRNARRSTGMRP